MTSNIATQEESSGVDTHLQCAGILAQSMRTPHSLKQPSRAATQGIASTSTSEPAPQPSHTSRDLSEYAGEVARLEGELESSRKTSAVAKDRLAETLLQVSELTAQKAALSARLDDRNGELERLQANYDKLQAELLVMAKAGVRVGEGEKAGQ